VSGWKKSHYFHFAKKADGDIFEFFLFIFDTYEWLCNCRSSERTTIYINSSNLHSYSIYRRPERENLLALQCMIQRGMKSLWDGNDARTNDDHFMQIMWVWFCGKPSRRRYQVGYAHLPHPPPYTWNLIIFLKSIELRFDGIYTNDSIASAWKSVTSQARALRFCNNIWTFIVDRQDTYVHKHKWKFGVPFIELHYTVELCILAVRKPNSI